MRKHVSSNSELRRVPEIIEDIKKTSYLFYIYCSVHRNILWNDQQMQQYAVSLFLCKSTLHVSGVHTPIIRSTGLTVSTVIGTIIGQAQIVSGTASQCSL